MVLVNTDKQAKSGFIDSLYKDTNVSGKKE